MNRLTCLPDHPAPTERRSLDICARCGAMGHCQIANPLDEAGAVLVELWCEDCIRLTRIILDDDGEAD